MKKLREQFDDILRNYSNASFGFNETLEQLIQAVEDFFKSTGKQGGTTTHTLHPEHLKAISKKGVEARRKKKSLL